tara:strand:- start:55 stop:633 length:579 start_codon:yes stop_codon:yes gene_type:complete
MNKKLLTLIAISLFVGCLAIFINNSKSEIPVGTIKIINKVNGHYLTVEELTLLDQFFQLSESLFGGQGNEFGNSKAGYVIAGQNKLKSICWLPVIQPDKTTAFQYVCSGKYHNYYLDIQDNVTSDGYLRLIVREESPLGFNWNVNSKEDGTFTYDSSRDRFKGYYMAISADDIAKVYFGEIGPYARWNQTNN